MSDPQDRPPAGNLPPPAPGGPPEQSPMPANPGGPPADTADEPVEAFDPTRGRASQPERPADASWEDVVDPVPNEPPDPPAAQWPEPRTVTRPAAPPTGRQARPAPQRPAAPTATAADDEYGDDDAYDDYEEEPVSRWVSLLATVGIGLIGIVTVQVVASLVEGLTLKSGQRVGVPDDLLHRIGYPFGGLGTTALAILVVGVILVSMPSVLGELLSESQDRLVGLSLVVAIAVGVIVAIGSLLAVRANLHEYSAKNVAVPTYVRVQFTNFLLGSLGAAALALFGAIAAMNERSRERYD